MSQSSIVEAATNTADPRAGLRAIVSLRTLTDTLELRQVEAALRAGLSWNDIAAALGVTRQAVHKKYIRRIDPSIVVPRRSS